MAPEEHESLYTVRFRPDTQTVTAVPLEELLRNAFQRKACYGAVYNVAPKGPRPDVEKDFARSVDRTHMLLHHGCNYVGVDVMPLGKWLEAHSLIGLTEVWHEKRGLQER